MKYISWITIFLFSLIILPSCMPQGASKGKSKEQVANKRQGQTDTRKTSISKAKKENDNAGKLAQQTYDENVKRLSESAVSRRPTKNNTSKSAANTNNNSPFAKTQVKLKDVSHERDRFIDTTYYMLKMENDNTEIMSNVVLAGGRTAEYFEQLIRAFDADVNKYENAEMYDCSNFLIYANQFDFNDSLRQKAIYYYADCCASRDLLVESMEALEGLVKNKMHRSIAPLALSKLGQIYCMLGERSKADRIFKRLKKEFPRSSLIQSADCSRM